MKSLIVDTSLGLQIIYYDSETNIQDNILEEKSKLSSIFHVHLDKILKKNNVSWDQLDHFIYNLGPGSYTGLKIAKGLAQTLALTKTKTIGYHEFEIPFILNHHTGNWIDNAFKNQYFIYEWDNKTNRHYLINKEDFFFSDKKKYFCKNKELWEKEDIVSTQKILMENASKFIELVVQREGISQDIFYYRAIDMEYQRS